MFTILRARMPDRLAFVISVVWYIALLAAVLYCAFEPQAELKYLAL